MGDFADLFKGFDLSKVSEDGREVLDKWKEIGISNLEAFKSESQALLNLGERTVKVVNSSLARLISGEIDSVAATRVAERSLWTGEDLARAEANLTAATAVRTLKDFGMTLLKIFPSFVS